MISGHTVEIDNYLRNSHRLILDEYQNPISNIQMKYFFFLILSSIFSIWLIKGNPNASMYQKNQTYLKMLGVY